MKNETIIQIFAPIVFIILLTSTFSTSALTTFGKTNPQTQNQPPPPPTPVGNARECKMDSDCYAIQNTTCMMDRPSGTTKTRCLCGDYSAPINGMCPNKPKAVHVPCNDNAECGEGAECIQKNGTTTGKKCTCKEGFEEENFKCNGAASILRFSSVALIAVALLFVNNVGFST